MPEKVEVVIISIITIRILPNITNIYLPQRICHDRVVAISAMSNLRALDIIITTETVNLREFDQNTSPAAGLVTGKMSLP